MDISYVGRRRERDLQRFIADPKPHKPVLLVEGARQVGKTTFVEHVLAGSAKPTVRINLERDSLDRMAFDECRDFAAFQDLLRDRHEFRPNADQVLFIDEAQESRELGGFVRFMKEEWPRATVVLSGSTLRRLFRAHTRYPVGRVRRLVLGAFSFSEFLRAEGQGHLADQVLGSDTQISSQRHDHLLARFDQFLAVGGMPAVVQAYVAGEDHGLVRRQIVADYEQDFIRLFGEDSVAIATACLRSVANFVGGVSKNTSVVPVPGSRVNARINEVFGRLESWHLILCSDQRGSSVHASHAYLPKRYLFDTGVLRELRESAVPAISAVHTMAAAARTPLGAIIENQTAVELARGGQPLAGWKRSPAGSEIDFIVKTGPAAFPVECKASLSVNLRHMRGLVAYLHSHGQRRGYIASLAPYAETSVGGVQIVNLPAYLLERLARGAP